jgi:carboxylesterase type B
LNATHYGKTCPQIYELGVFAAPTSTSEDCLYLNVFTTGERHSKKPVIVWIHGGGNFDGESNDYDGSKLATGGPIGTPTVVVTLNYRLNMFGFFSHPAINAEGHLWGNYGILDQQAVLGWFSAMSRLSVAIRPELRSVGNLPARRTLPPTCYRLWPTGGSTARLFRVPRDLLRL